MFKNFLIISFAILIIIIGFILFFPFESFIKKQIEKAFESKILIKELKISFHKISAKDVYIKSQNEHVFSKVKEIELKPYFFALFKKRLDIKSIYLVKPSVTLVRTKKNIWLIPDFFSKNSSQNQSIEFKLKSLGAQDGTFLLKDEIKNLKIELFNINLLIKSTDSIFKSGQGVITASAKFKDGGELLLSSEGDFNTKTFKGIFTLKNLNILTIKPFLKGNAQIKKGILSLNSNFILNNNYIKAPCQLTVKELEVEPRGVLMGVMAPVLIKLIEKRGEIVLNFNVWGPSNNLQTDFEESLKRKISEELGMKVFSPFQNLTKPFQSIIKKY
ncbi:MAG: AsmA family protein [Thermodesulfovibrio sp.]|nr:AsmA family protein [Thermodesulfovibrio sp.]